MELIYGAEASAAVERNLRDVEGFAARLDVQAFDEHAAAHTGRLRAELKRAGRPIGLFDEMIAGHARSRGLVQVAIAIANNSRNFKQVAGFRLESWAN